jgi:hypothetical protein
MVVNLSVVVSFHASSTSTNIGCPDRVGLLKILQNVSTSSLKICVNYFNALLDFAIHIYGV